METKELVYSAVASLLGVCDGAVSEDGMGFNKMDGYFAREMYAKYPAWSPRMLYATWKMVRKYRGQLSGFGIDFDAIPAPPVPEEKSKSTTSTTTPKPEDTSRVLSVEGKSVVVRFSYNPDVVLAVKEIPGRRFDGTRKVWTVPMTLDSISRLVPVAARYGFRFDTPETSAAIASLGEQAKRSVEASKATDSTIEVPGLLKTLRPFQKAGVAYALDKKRTYIADEMGLGKTVQAIATIQAAGAYPALIICPASLKYNWAKEWRGWVSGRTVAIVNGKNTGDPATADVVIINYDILRKNAESLKSRGFKSVVMDESHYLKNYKAQRTEAAKDLVKGIEYRLALTGTPVLNRPQELLSQLGILGRLNDFGGFWTFAKRFCDAHPARFGWDFSGASNLDELNTKMRTSCYIRRKKSEVLAELPAKTRTTVEVDLSNRAEYQDAEKNLIAYLREVAAAETEFLASLEGLDPVSRANAIRARQDSAEAKARRAETLVRINTLRRVVGRGKIESVREWVENFIESGEKLVLFANHIEVQKSLLAAFPNAAHVLGEDPADVRQANVERFQTDPTCQVIVCSLVAAGVGITLTAASNVAFCEFGWTPSLHEQAEDRVHRIGQTAAVNAWYLVGDKTIDGEILDLIDRKRTVTNAVHDGDESGAGAGILNELVASLMAR